MQTKIKEIIDRMPNFIKKGGVFIKNRWYIIVTLICLYVAIEIDFKLAILSYIGLGLAKVLRNYIHHKEAIHSNLMMTANAFRSISIRNKVGKKPTHKDD